MVLSSIMLKVERQPVSVVNSVFSNSKKATGTFAGTSDAFDTGSGNMNKMKGTTQSKLLSVVTSLVS